MISWLKRTRRVSFPQVTVVTDYDVHGMWLSDACERYFVACQEARANLAAHRVVESIGIPIDPLFARKCRAMLQRAGRA